MTLIPEFSSRSSNIVGERAYRLTGIEQMLTPVLIILLDMVDSNIAATIKIAGGDPNRLRPHIKTAKLLRVVRRYVESCSASARLRLNSQSPARQGCGTYWSRTPW
jgi:hypothetical protein